MIFLTFKLNMVSFYIKKKCLKKSSHLLVSDFFNCLIESYLLFKFSTGVFFLSPSNKPSWWLLPQVFTTVHHLLSMLLD